MKKEQNKLFLYKGNPKAIYFRNSQINWLICNENTKGFIPLDDPDGKRAAQLNKEAVPAKLYRYKDNNAIYLKNLEDNWFISNDFSSGFVKINDPNGERAIILNKEAVYIGTKELLYWKENASFSDGNTKQLFISNPKVRTLIIISISLLVFSIFYFDKSDLSQDKPSCNSFDACISSYDFETAYVFYNEIDGKNDPSAKYFSFKKLISAQVNFWCGKKDFKKAFNILNEHTMMASYKLNTDDEKANDSYNEEAGFMNSQLEFIINEMLIEGIDKKTIKKFAVGMKPIVIGDNNNISFLGEFNSYVLSDRPYKEIIKRINK